MFKKFFIVFLMFFLLTLAVVLALNIASFDLESPITSSDSPPTTTAVRITSDSLNTADTSVITTKLKTSE